MALNENDRKYVDSFFTPGSREAEYAWVEKLSEIIPMYQEMGFTRGEGAILFLLSQMLTQISFIGSVVKRWDEEEE